MAGGEVRISRGSFNIGSQVEVNIQDDVSLLGVGAASILKQSGVRSAYTNQSLLYVVDSENFRAKHLTFQGRNTKTWSTTLSANANGSDTTITVASNSGMAVGDAIGIVKNTGADPHLTTISAINGTTITLAAAVPAGTPFASSGNGVYAMDDAIYLLNIANSPAAKALFCEFVNGWGGGKSSGGHEHAMLNLSQAAESLTLGCWFNNGGNWGMQIGGGTPRATNGKIVGCHFVNTRIEAGLKIYNSDHISVAACTFEDNAEAGLSMESAASENQFCTIESNQFSGAGIGIEVYNSNLCTFKGNHIDTPDTTDGIQIMSGTGQHDISGNAIYNTARHGILVKSNDCSVRANKVLNATQAGIILYNANRCKVTDNYVIDADDGDTDTYGGIEVQADVGQTANYNIIKGNTSICSVAGAKTTYGVMVRDARCTGTLIKDNVLTPSNVGAIYDSGTLTVYQRSLFVPATAFIPNGGSALGLIGTATPAILMDAAAEESALAVVGLPHDYSGGDIEIVPLWAINTNTGNIVARTLAAAVSNNEGVDVAADVDTGEQAIAVPGTALLRFSSTTATLDASEVAALTDHLRIQVVRNGASGSDTAAGDAGFIGVDIRYSANIVS